MDWKHLWWVCENRKVGGYGKVEFIDLGSVKIVNYLKHPFRFFHHFVEIDCGLWIVVSSIGENAFASLAFVAVACPSVRFD